MGVYGIDLIRKVNNQQKFKYYFLKNRLKAIKCKQQNPVIKGFKEILSQAKALVFSNDYTEEMPAMAA